jgi:hypothetical protein
MFDEVLGSGENEIIALREVRMSVRLELPADASLQPEPDIVVAPESTAKGEAQQRGERLAASTVSPRLPPHSAGGSNSNFTTEAQRKTKSKD